MSVLRRQPKDGRATYRGEGLRGRFQNVYKQDSRGKVIRGEDGAAIVDCWRFCAYEWLTIDGKPVKSQTVFVRFYKDPDTLTRAERAEIDREAKRKLTEANKRFELMNAAGADLVTALATQDADGVELAIKMAQKALQNAGKSKAERAAAERVATLAARAATTFEAKAETVKSAIVEEAADLEIKSAEFTLAKKLNSIGVAAAQFVATADIEETTRAGYIGFLQNHLLPSPLAEMLLSEVRKADIEAWENSLAKPRQIERVAATPVEILKAAIDGQKLPTESREMAALSPISSKKVVMFLKAVANYASRDSNRWPGGVASDLLAYKPKAAPKRKKEFVPKTNQFKQFVTAAEKLDLSYMIPFMALIRVSFRPGEARALRWSDLSTVDSSGKTITVATIGGVARKIKGQGSQIARGKAKTAASLETVVMPVETVALLTKWRKPGSEFVCPPAPPSKSGREPLEFLSTDSSHKAWGKIRAEVGLPDTVDIYTLKHGLITELILAGRSIDEIILMTRHTSREMVERIYAAVSAGDLADAIDRLE